MKIFKYCTLGLLLSLFLVQEVYGKGFRSSRSFSSSWGSKSSKKSYSRSWSPFKKSTTSKSVGSRSAGSSGSYSSGSKKAVANSSSFKMSAADKKLAKTAKQNGTSYRNRNEAVKSFQKKNVKKYTSTYNSKPTNRPSHIPSKTNYNGRDYDVVYNQGKGGYGYFGPSGKWMAYNVMKDAVMLSLLMRSNNYYYPAPHSLNHHNLYENRPSMIGSFISSIGTLLFIGIVLAAIGGSLKGNL